MTKRDLFSGTGGSTQIEDAAPTPSDERALCIERSSLWAAYGDALGWISELTDEPGLNRRTGGGTLYRPIKWERRIGGRSGVRASLPAGCYSDDSQLRLATSRAIRADGFDVEAFAKVELPVWLSYGLGGGKSTSAAAEQIGRPRSVWWSNRFRGWTQSGGNGAAMRIQPHVWASRSLADPQSYLPTVVRNSVCTHSHPNGLLGAVLHALCVAHAMRSGSPPSPDELQSITEASECLPDIIANDPELGFWRVAFEQEAGDLNGAWAEAVDAMRQAMKLTQTCKMLGQDGYAAIVDSLNLRDPARRGSGVLTALAALALTWCEPRPAEALRIAANALGTDTDTIATMAGAMLGAGTEIAPPVEVLDADLFRAEARRLARVAVGESPPSHPYPDLLHWTPPRTRADALMRTNDGKLEVLGLGPGNRLDGEAVLGRGDFCWQWVRLEFGQTLLIKSRRRLAEAPARPALEVRRDPDRLRADVPQTRQAKTPVSSPATPDLPPAGMGSAGGHDIREVVAFMEKHIDDDRLVGKTFRRVVSKGTTADIAAFAAALVRMLGKDAEPGGTEERI